jgi:AcrR family transcriptional regulator
VERSQRSRILGAMVDIVSEQGYTETKLIDVIEAAGVSRKTFYEMFDDKEDCYLAAYNMWLRLLLRMTTDAFEAKPSDPWADRLRVGLGAFLHYIADFPKPARFCLVDVLAAGSRALARRDAAIRQFTHFLDAGRAEADLDPPGLTALTLVGGVNELLYTEILHGATAQLPERLPELMFLLTLPYLGSERAEAECFRARAFMPKLETAPWAEAGGAAGAI